MGPEVVSAWIHEVNVDLGFISDDVDFVPDSYPSPKMPRRSPRKKRTDDALPDSQDSDEAFNTPRPLRRGVFTGRLHGSALPSLTLARSPTRSSTNPTQSSSSARSSSPIKRVDDLLRLEKPVQWTLDDLDDLKRRMQPSIHTTDNALPSSNTTAGSDLLASVLRRVNYGCIPHEIRDIFRQVLPFQSTMDVLFTDANIPTPVHSLSPSLAQFVIQPFGTLDSEQAIQFMQRFALLNEFNALQSIVARTKEFSTTSRSEAAWNEKVHSPTLELAVLNTSGVAVENVTRANIIGDFIPLSTATFNTQAKGKMVDYALVLQPELQLKKRLLDFLSHFDYPVFNQTNYPPLQTCPASIFVETKVKENGQSIAEAKIQLGIWVASWFNRVAEFPREVSSTSSGLPFVPVLLVDRGAWELYFAFDRESEYNICGPIEIGNTRSLKEAYRLLACLRDLVDWMGTQFRAWVESCLTVAESLYG